MKSFASQLWVKILSVILLVPLTLVCLIHVTAIVILAENNALIEDGPGVEDELIVGLMQRDLKLIRLASDYPYSGADTDSRESTQINLAERFQPEASNFIFTLYDAENNVILMNELVTDAEAKVITTQQVYDSSTVKTVSRTFADEEAALAFEQSCREQKQPDFETTDIHWDWDKSGTVTVTIRSCPVVKCRVNAALRNPLTVKDKYFYAIRLFRQLVEHRTWLLISTPVWIALALMLLVLLISGVGRKNGTDAVYIGWPDKIPFDLFALIIAGLTILPSVTGFRQMVVGNGGHFSARVLYFTVVKLVQILLILWLVLSLVRRAKIHNLLRNTLIWRMIQLLRRSLTWIHSNISVVWRVSVLWLIFTGLEAFALLRLSATGLLYVWIGEKLVLTAMIILLIVNLQRLEEGSRALSLGDLHTKMNLRGLYPGLRQYAENLNGISDAMQRSLNEQMRSEHMKAELITNVSHDIKTPLTAIINYVELLKKEGLDAPAAQEYLTVLDRQSDRLKKLVVDLVEASKASTGSLQIDAEEIDGNLLLSQAAGEYDERIRERELTLIYDQCPEPLRILADPKLLWRVFDNLLNNAFKYAKRGTRIYLSSQKTAGRATICFRNVSEQMLNISPEELMERFVRGDTSRNTEGSGLGLSIARSLTELQGGQFEIHIDGDLFKACISFPLLEAGMPEPEMTG